MFALFCVSVFILHLPIMVMMVMMDEIAKGLLIATAINKVSAYEGLEQQNEGGGGVWPKSRITTT